MLKGLFINTPKAICSIHESGLMVFNCIKNSTKFSIDYCEINPEDLQIPASYDFYLFNYHIVTTNWLDTRSIKKLPGCKGTIVLEILPNDPFVYCSPFDFDFYCILDPSMAFKHKKVFVFPRPLDRSDVELSRTENEVPVIGSFGFATKGKGFKHVVQAVNSEFEKAIVRINIPHGTYTDESHAYAHQLARECKALAKPGIDVVVTHDFISKEELIYWCSQNTLNCFLYDRQMPGLAATTDQAITSERPLSVSGNSTFRHILQYLKPYPEWSLKYSIRHSASIIKKMKEDWSADSFLAKFEKMITGIAGETNNPASSATVKLSILNKKKISYRIRKILLKLIRVYYKSVFYAGSH